MAQRDEPIACSLPLREAAEQAGEWTDLQGQALAYEEIAGGVTVRYPGEIADRVESLVEREAACCAWLSLETERSSDTIVVRLTSDNPDAGPVIRALVGA